MRLVRRCQFGRSAGLVAGQGKVGDPHGEPVIGRQRQVTQEQLPVAERVKHGHLDGMHALRQDLFGHKTPLAVHGDRVPGHPHAVPLGNRVAVDLHGTAVNRDVTAVDAAFAVTGQQFPAGIRIGRWRIDMIDHPQILTAGFVETPLGIIHPHPVLQLESGCTKGIELGLPLGHAVGIHSDDLRWEGHGQIGLFCKS